MNYLETILFYAFSSVLIATSLFVVTAKRPTYAVLALALGIIALSGLFTLLGAYFVAIIQVLIYAGAILVLFLFVIMLLGVDTQETAKKNSKVWATVGGLLTLSFLVELIGIIAAQADLHFSGEALVGTTEAIGRALFSEYLLPFELVSGVLLLGILGVVGLARKESQKNP